MPAWSAVGEETLRDWGHDGDGATTWRVAMGKRGGPQVTSKVRDTTERA